MPFTKYSKWDGVDGQSLSLEELLDQLADLLLESGFNDPYFMYGNERDESLAALREAIMRALMDGLLSDEELEALSDDQGRINAEAMAELIDRLIERLIEEGYLNLREEPGEQPPPSGFSKQAGKTGKPVEQSVKFELRDKGLDFLGFKSLRDLLASLGKSSFGRHDTNHLATGVEASNASRPYEFGDTLNLD